MPDTPQPISRKGLSIAVILAGSFIPPLLLHSSTLAIPNIAAELRLTAETISWFTLINVLANALFVLPAGKFADIYGRRRVFCVGVVLLTLACLLSGRANSEYVLLLGRFLQGIGGAFIFGSALPLVNGIPQEHQKAKLMGMYLSVCYLGVVLGPLFGGVVLEHLHWRWTFYIPAIILFVIAIAGIGFLHWERYGNRASRVRGLDTFLYAIALSMIALAIFRTHEPLGQGLLLLGLLCFAGFCWFQSKRRDPLLQVKLFLHNSIYTTLGFTHFFNYCAILALPFTLTLYLQYIKGINPQTTGLILMSQALFTTIVAPMSGRLSSLIRVRYLLFISLTLVFSAMLILSMIALETPIWVVLVCLVMIGLGVGIGDVHMINTSLSSVEDELLGSASATLNGLRTMGGFVGIGVVSYLLGQDIGKKEITPDVYPELLVALQSFFVFAAAICFASLLSLSVGIWFRSKK